MVKTTENTVTEGGLRGAKGFAVMRFCHIFGAVLRYFFILRFQNTKRIAVTGITTSRSQLLVKKVSAVMTFFRMVSLRLFCKHEISVLPYNASGFII